MPVKRLLTLGILLLTQAIGAEKPTAAHAKTLFRDFALAACIAQGYSSAEVKADASAVASGYLENGSYPLEAYNEARELARKALEKDYPSIANAKLTLMKCIDFSQGPQVTNLMRKYAKPGKR